MKEPYFPIAPSVFTAELKYNDFKPGDDLDMGDGITIKTLGLNHPGGSVGFRISFGGKSVCYLTDVEYLEENASQMTEFIKDADILIFDSTFDDAEFAQYKGFGHSTWQQGAKLAEAANIGQFIAFHHQPGNDDATLDQIAARLEKQWSGGIIAREGMKLDL